jgi:hypothetical protein
LKFGVSLELGALAPRALSRGWCLELKNIGFALILLLAILARPAFSQSTPPCGTIAHFLPGVNLDGWTGGSTFQEQDQSVALLKELGARLVRINAPWHALEPETKGVYDTNLLAFYDHIVPALCSNGMRCIFVNATTPYWASADPAKSGGGNWNPLYKPSNVTNYSDFLVFLANRYKPFGSNVFEVWNEENTAYFWPSGVSAADYFLMLRSAYAAVKQADPNALVINGGLADTGSTASYLNNLYTAGARPFFDVLSQHVYPRTPESEVTLNGVRLAMLSGGDSAKKVWITECGWPTYYNPSDPNAVNVTTQALYLTNLFTRLANYSYASGAMWYNLRDYDPTVKEGSFGILYTNFTKKPAFDALKTWIATASISCPPVISSLSRLSNGPAHLSFRGTTGFVYTVQCSSNLLAWQTVATNVTGTNASYSFDDPTPAPSSCRFYRVLWP